MASQSQQDALFEKLQQADVRIGLRNDRIAFGGNASAISPELADFIKANLQQLNESARATQKQYDYAWKQHLSQTCSGLSDLSLSGALIKKSRAAKNAESTFEKISCKLTLDRALPESDLDCILRSAWALVLHRYTNNESVVFLSSNASHGAAKQPADEKNRAGERPQAVLNPLVDHFSISPAASFESVIATAEKNRSLMQGKGYPSQKLLEKTLLLHSSDASLLIVNTECALNTEKVSSFFEIADHNFVYILDIQQQSNVLEITLFFNVGRSTQAAAHRIAAYYRQVVSTFLKSELRTAEVSHYDFLEKGDRLNLVTRLAGAEIELPQNICISHLFESQASQTPNAVCLQEGSSTLTYSEVRERVDALLANFACIGVQAGQPVGVYMSKSIDLVVATLAIMKAGCAYLPIDKSVPPERIQNICQNAQVQFLLTDSDERKACLESLQLHEAQWVLLYRDVGLQEGVDDVTVQPIVCQQDDTAYIIYTSGSTGAPKGVAVSHRALTSFLLHCKRVYSTEEMRSVLFSTRICFDLSIIELFAAFLFGGKLVIVEDILELADAEQSLDVSFIGSVPSVMTQLLDVRDLPASTRTLNLGGEPLRSALVNRVFEQSGVTRLHNVYGPTESTVFSTTSLYCGPVDDEPVIGKPVGNTYALVLDASGNLLPQGVVGELFLAGLNTASGYVNAEALTAERFISDSKYLPGKAMYRTGDFVRWNEEGELEFIGRKDQQIKLRGFRIEIDEIEVALASVEDVLEGAVVLHRDETQGDALIAYVTVNNSLAPQTILKALAQSLPEYMVPAKCIVLDSMPNTASGKIDRKNLAARNPHTSTSVNKTAPSNPLQKAICRAFEETLGVTSVGLEDDFFALGGHSLMIGKLVRKLRAYTQVNISLRSIFDFSQVEKLEQHLRALQQVAHEEHDQTLAAVSLPTEPVYDVEASVSQQSYWYKASLQGATPEYNLAYGFRFLGELNEAALIHAYSDLLAKHHALRTVLYQNAEGIRQRVLENYDLPFVKLDIEDVDDEQIARTKAREWIEHYADMPFDLARDCPIRLVLVPISQEESFVLLVVHHSAADGVAVANIFLDLECSYSDHQAASLYANKSGELNKKAENAVLQFANYAQWQKAWLASSEGKASLAYWEQKLAGLPVLHTLPTDYLRPATQSGSGMIWRQHIPADLTANLKSLCSSRGASLFMGLQAAFAWLLASVSQQKDVVMGTPSAGRHSEVLEAAVGNFMNTVILRNHIEAQTSFAELLEDAKATVLSAFEHEYVPVEVLTAKLAELRDDSFNPLYQIWFVMQNQEKEMSRFADLKVQGLEQHYSERKHVHFDLSLSVSEENSALELYWGYKPELFKEATVARLAYAYLQVLQYVVQYPEAAMFVDLHEFNLARPHCRLSPGLFYDRRQLEAVLTESVDNFHCEIEKLTVNPDTDCNGTYRAVLTVGSKDQHLVSTIFNAMANKVKTRFPEYLRNVHLLSGHADISEEHEKQVVSVFRELDHLLSSKFENLQANAIALNASAQDVELYISAVILGLAQYAESAHFDLFFASDENLNLHAVQSGRSSAGVAKHVIKFESDTRLECIHANLCECLSENSLGHAMYVRSHDDHFVASLNFSGSAIMMDIRFQNNTPLSVLEFKEDVLSNLNLLQSTAYISVADVTKYTRASVEATMQDLKSRFG